MNSGREIISLVAERQDLEQFRRKNWEGTFEEYLDIVRAEPRVTRNAFERVYDMLMSYGTESYEEFVRSECATASLAIQTIMAATRSLAWTIPSGAW